MESAAYSPVLLVKDVSIEKSQSVYGDTIIDNITIIFHLEDRDESWVFTKESLREYLLELKTFLKI
jgi:hypothetical protein